jgi:hypothetical protein
MAQQQLILPGQSVKMSNELARVHLPVSSVFCGRIIAGFVSLIKSEDADFQTYSVQAKAIIPGFRRHDGAVYREIMTAADTLLRSIVTLERDAKGFAKCALFSFISYREGILTARFDPALKPHLLGLKERFTLYPLSEYIALSSVTAQALYEILRSWDDQISIEIPLEKLHEMLNSKPSYVKRFQDFERRVLNPAVREIHEKTAFRFRTEKIYGHRKKVVALKFIFKERQRHQQPELPSLSPPALAEEPKPAPGPLPIVGQAMPGDPAPPQRPEARRRLAPLSAEDLEARRALLRAQAKALKATAEQTSSC